MKGLALLLAIFVISLTPITSYSFQDYPPQKEVKEDEPVRFSMGYRRMFAQGRHMNAMETFWKFPSDKGMFGLSIGASKPREQDIQVVEGDLEAEIIPDFLTLQLPQEYSITKHIKSTLVVGQVEYQYYWTIRNGEWWMLPWEFYVSTGLIGHFYMEFESKKYLWKLQFDEDQIIEDKLALPGGTVREGFDFYFPGCANFDIKLLTFRTCALFGVEKPKGSGFYTSASWGF